MWLCATTVAWRRSGMPPSFHVVCRGVSRSSGRVSWLRCVVVWSLRSSWLLWSLCHVVVVVIRSCVVVLSWVPFGSWVCIWGVSKGGEGDGDVGKCTVICVSDSPTPMPCKWCGRSHLSFAFQRCGTSAVVNEGCW
jgi:hypothetical protein